VLFANSGTAAKGSLGIGTLYLQGGTLATTSGGARTLYNPAVLQGNVTFGDAVWSGTVIITGTVGIVGTSQFNTVSPLSLTGVISGSTDTLTKTGSSLLHLNAANTFTNPFRIDQGIVRLSNASAGGTNNTIYVNTGGLLGASAAIPNALNVNGGKLASIGGDNSFSGSITATGATFTSLDALTGSARALTFSGQITTSANNVITIEGPVATDFGTGAPAVILSNTNNASILAGGFSITGGQLALSNLNAQGTGPISMSATSAMAFTGSRTYSLSNSFTIAASSLATLATNGGSGANDKANTTLSGTFIVGTNSELRFSMYRGSLTITQPIQVNSGVVLSATGSSTDVTVGGILELASSTDLVFGRSGGTGTISLSGTGNWSGSTTVNAGILSMAHEYAIAATNIPQVTVNAGGFRGLTAALGGTGQNLSGINMAGTATTLHLRSDFAGTLPTAEVMGSVNLEGNVTIASTATGSLTFGGDNPFLRQTSGGNFGATVARPIVLDIDGTGTTRFTINGAGNNAFNINGGITETVSTTASPKKSVEMFFEQGSANGIVLNGTSTYTGGTIVGTAGNSVFVDVRSGGSLGEGNVLVQNGSLRLALATGIATGAKVHTTGSGTLQVGFDTDGSILTGTSAGKFQIGATNTQITNLATLGGGLMTLGAYTGSQYLSVASLAPNTDGIYRLGGGGGMLVLPNEGMLTGTASVQVGGGVALLGSNSYSGGTVVNGATTLTVGNDGALGSGSVQFNSVGGILNLLNVGTLSNTIIFAQSTTAGITMTNSGTNPTIISGPISLTGVGARLNISGTGYLRITGDYTTSGTSWLFVDHGGGLLEWRPGTVTSEGRMELKSGLTAITSAADLPSGNFHVNGGTLVLDNLSWTDFYGARTYGTGTGQFQFASGGFAARGTALLVSGGPVGSNTFDRDFSVGSTYAVDGQLYCNAPVDIRVDTYLTAVRNVAQAATGSGFWSPASGVKYTLSGNFSGSGALTFSQGTATREIVLAGTDNRWTGSAGYVSSGGKCSVDSGLGGLVLTSPSGGTGGGNILWFQGDASLPKGAGLVSGTAFIGAIYQGGNGSEYHGAIMLTTTTGAGENYSLETGYTFFFGNAVESFTHPGALGAGNYSGTAGKATLENSTVQINAAGTNASKKMGIYPLADQTLVLGSSRSLSE
jgi:autotransporter-associated beta strand protein